MVGATMDLSGPVSSILGLLEAQKSPINGPTVSLIPLLQDIFPTTTVGAADLRTQESSFISGLFMLKTKST